MSRGVALLMDLGTGKTLTAIAIAGSCGAQRVLVVAPASVVPVWPREFAQWADYPVAVTPLVGAGVKRIKQVRELEDIDELQVVVTNYESIGRNRGLEDALAAWGPDMVIADEQQRIKTPGAQQSKALQRLGARASYRLGLTGTPGVPQDWFGQWKFLDPSIFGSSRTAHNARYFHEVSLGEHAKMIVGPRVEMLPELTAKAHSIAYRVAKEDCLDLPPCTNVDRFCEIDGKARTAYQRLVKESIAELSGGEMVVAQNVLTRILKLQQYTGGFATDDTGKTHAIHTRKLDLLDEVIDDLGDKPVVIFARFRAELDAIHSRLAGRGSVARIDGSTDMKLRGPLVEQFQSGEHRFFLAQIRAAGLGITLTAADTAVFYSVDYSLENYEQARGRVHRIGQSRPVTYVHLLVRDSVDEAVAGALASKQDIATLVTDRWREVVGHGVAKPRKAVSHG